MKIFTKNKKWAMKFLKRNKSFVLAIIILVLFPIIVGLVYTLPLKQFVAIESGDLLSYYGTTFGILGSFITYRYEVNKHKKERINDLRPWFEVEVKRDNKELNLFTINVINHSQRKLSFLYFYDEFVSTIIKQNYSFKTTFNKSVEDTDIIKPDYNITMDSDILDDDKFPKYVQLICDDSDGNSWNCCYYKVKDCDHIYYYPREIEMI